MGQRIRIKRGSGIVASLAILVVLTMYGTAFADHSVDDKSNGNHLFITITKSGNFFACTGTNYHTGGVILSVSAVCQYKLGTKWYDMATAVRSSQLNRTEVTVTYDDNPCTPNDGGANLPDGRHYKIRGQADGYWVEAITADYHEYVGALETTSPFYEAAC